MKRTPDASCCGYIRNKCAVLIRLTAALVLYCCCFAFLLGVPLSGNDEAEVIILATADLHGSVQQLQQAVAPAVAGEYRRNPGQVIYVDVGDTAQGTWLVNQQRGRGMLQALAAAGCELWVPGTHELEFGFTGFQALVREFPGWVLAANLHAPELAGDFQQMKIVERSGVKIAFIGLMLKNMNNCFPVAESRFQTTGSSAVLRQQVQSARRQGAEIIVLLRHAGKYGGGENLSELLRRNPEIDLVVGAHTHLAEPGCRIGNVWYVQPPAHGKKLLKVKMFYSRKRRQVKQIESFLLELPDIRDAVPAAALRSAPALNNIQSEHDFAGIIRRKLRCDLAVYAIGNKEQFRRLLAKKSPRVIDYYQVFSYFDPFITVQVTAGEFRQIIREYGLFAHKRKQLLGVSGCQVRLHRGKLQELLMSEDKEHYSLAISAYAGAGAGGQLPGVRRILQHKIDHQQAENAMGILDLLTSGE